MPGMSAEQLSQLSSAVIHMNMQAQAAGAPAQDAVHQRASEDQAVDADAPAAANPGGFIGYVASYPLRSAQTKKNKEAKKHAKMQKAKAQASLMSGNRTLQQQGGGIRAQLGTPPPGSGARRQQNPMLSMPPGDDSDDMGID